LPSDQLSFSLTEDLLRGAIVSLRQNTLINFAGQIAAVVISLTTVPPFLRLIGEARYGVMVIVWLLLGYFSLFDLGLSQATAQRMATLKASSENDRATLLWTSLTMNALLGVIAALVLSVVGYFVLGRFVSMDATLRQESLRALPWISLALPISMAASTLSGALLGREAFGATTLVGTLGQLMGQCFPLYVAWRYSHSLEGLVAALLVARLVSLLLLIVICRSLVPLAWPPRHDRTVVRHLLGYGGWVTVSSIVGPLMSSMDRLIIGGLADSKAVTYYSVPFGLASRLLMIPSSLSGVLFPRFASSDRERRDSLADTSIRLLACVMTPGIVLALLLVRPFLAVWISADFAAKAAVVSQLILLGVWSNGLALIAHSNLQAKGRPDLVAKVHLVELPAYLAVLAGSLHLWGVVGAAIAWTARVTADALVLFALSGHLRSIGSKLGVPAALLGLAAAFVWMAPQSLTAIWLGGPVLMLFSLIWSFQTFPPGLVRFRISANG
jgi:O-antigen/teichoic acid export membrane protein